MAPTGACAEALALLDAGAVAGKVPDEAAAASLFALFAFGLISDELALPPTVAPLTNEKLSVVPESCRTLSPIMSDPIAL